MSKLPSGLYFTILPEEYVEDAWELETQGYPADEAASLDVLRYRQNKAPELFIGAFLASTRAGSKSVLIGFVTSTGTPSPTVTLASMSTHVPNSPTIALHSVCVAPMHRRLGIATALLREYARRGREGLLGAEAKKIALLTHARLQPLYERAGFTLVGPSSVHHGKEKWYHMALDLTIKPVHPAQPYDQVPTPEPAPQTPYGQADILAALNAPRPRVEKCRFWHDLVKSGEEKDAEGRNALRMVCSRPGCGSVILNAGIGELRESEEGFWMMDAIPRRPSPYFHVLDPSLPWWLIRGDAMVFENVGFSRPIGDSAPTSGPYAGRARKLLICAECDLGPVGWHFEGGGQGQQTEYWINVDRVGYR